MLKIGSIAPNLFVFWTYFIVRILIFGWSILKGRIYHRDGTNVPSWKYKRLIVKVHFSFHDEGRLNQVVVFYRRGLIYAFLGATYYSSCPTILQVSSLRQKRKESHALMLSETLFRQKFVKNLSNKTLRYQDFLRRNSAVRCRCTYDVDSFR